MSDTTPTSPEVAPSPEVAALIAARDEHPVVSTMLPLFRDHLSTVAECDKLISAAHGTITEIQNKARTAVLSSLIPLSIVESVGPMLTTMTKNLTAIIKGGGRTTLGDLVEWADTLSSTLVDEVAHAIGSYAGDAQDAAQTGLKAKLAERENAVTLSHALFTVIKGFGVYTDDLFPPAITAPSGKSSGGKSGKSSGVKSGKRVRFYRMDGGKRIDRAAPHCVRPSSVAYFEFRAPSADFIDALPKGWQDGFAPTAITLAGKTATLGGEVVWIDAENNISTTDPATSTPPADEVTTK